MELKSVEDTSWLQLFIKNTALCKHESGRIRCDACPILRLAASQSPMFLVNSRHPQLCAPTHWLPNGWAPLSRSYGGILPSSFNIVLSSALVCSTSPPVSV